MYPVPTDSTPTLLLADSQPIYLLGLRMVVDDLAGYDLIHEAHTSAEILDVAHRVRPDIAIIDIAAPGMRGLATLRHLRHEAPAMQVVVTSLQDAPSFVRETVQAGARAFVSKRSPPDCLLQALHAVRSGGFYLDPSVATDMIVAGFGPRTRRGQPRGTLTLTDREREVFRLIALGYTNKEVAGQLGLTAKSVETYKSRASGKLDIYSRSKIVQYAALQGWFNEMGA
ncbi:response regulator [Methylobacterium symbioticum]|uniref:Transcriptional regulator n=1 Tax=Methylobacterium symbioticum TaxID=2584084 RepID=A0A509EC44_9HYPH|nr:response regulator transcription factor [Methylobacterium symbioticum]VUD70733.1 Putative transcriptional regulator [Methylobacterium symbioticum]